jgi:hypothetical protein
MDAFLVFVEGSDLSMWFAANCMPAFPTIITLHAICMGLLARASAVIDIRTLGMAPGADAPMRIKLIAGTSLAMWVGVLICGRMLAWSGHLFSLINPMPCRQCNVTTKRCIKTLYKTRVSSR